MSSPSGAPRGPWSPGSRGAAWLEKGRAWVQGTPPAEPVALDGAALDGAGFDADPAVRTYLWQSLVATLLCCLPTGAVALVHASIAQNRLQSGDLDGARQASARARRWCVVSLIAFVAVLLLYLVAVVIIVAVAQRRS
ncbi:CD225/dispanin family protein [Frankia sp. AgKG'84/4]|uniref:CD225/dispanin family protein n=1 Tax=Frankia sp. AgKG'84/4 TaxID=573490 RepID=UPI00200E8398|nr:CD225/dispanin family protein [Frankia sp. AgKG'84/4]MCL9796429.1 CD225/dispanin family protein [Frankia sp. AgKG'84/4]